MFDNLRIHPDLLPITEEEKILLKEACEGSFQTKSLQRRLTMVEITSEGKLRWEDFEWEEVPKSERPYPDAPNTSLLSILGSMQRINHRWIEESTFSGEVRFYESVNEVWYEFCALFAQGELLKIMKISPK